jgi:hypothetical protein
LQCKTQINESKELDKVDWSNAYPGLEIHRPKYGIVVHTVPLLDLNFDNKEETIANLEEQNNEIAIVDIAPLRRKDKATRKTQHQSIIVFTNSPSEADLYIRRGFSIASEILPAEGYAPQFTITQCFNCYEYGHRGHQCKRKTNCGKCSSEHKTEESKSTNLICAQCGGIHAAWWYECPKRIQESVRLAEEKYTAGPYFTRPNQQ